MQPEHSNPTGLYRHSVLYYGDTIEVENKDRLEIWYLVHLQAPDFAQWESC